MILGCIGVLEGNVADDAERYKRNAVDMARLGYCRRLHIYGCRFWKMTYYLAHLLAGVNKPVAGYYQSGMYSR